MSYSELETALMKGAVELEIEHCLGLVTTRSVAMAFKKYVEPLILPAADRDAIREAMQGALDFIKGPTTGGWEHIVKLTAALALIGEEQS